MASRRLTAAEAREDREKALATLREWLKPGKEVYTLVRTVSRSGMSRKISVFITAEKSSSYEGSRQGIVDIGWYVSRVLGWKLDCDNHSITVGGCGMDMGFHLVYSLGRALYPEGFKLNRKAGQRGRNGDKSEFDTDGGYSLKQVWL